MIDTTYTKESEIVNIFADFVINVQREVRVYNQKLEVYKHFLRTHLFLNRF